MKRNVAGEDAAFTVEHAVKSVDAIPLPPGRAAAGGGGGAGGNRVANLGLAMASRTALSGASKAEGGGLLTGISILAAHCRCSCNRGPCKGGAESEATVEGAARWTLELSASAMEGCADADSLTNSGKSGGAVLTWEPFKTTGAVVTVGGQAKIG